MGKSVSVPGVAAVIGQSRYKIGDKGETEVEPRTEPAFGVAEMQTEGFFYERRNRRCLFWKISDPSETETRRRETAWKLF